VSCAPRSSRGSRSSLTTAAGSRPVTAVYAVTSGRADVVMLTVAATCTVPATPVSDQVHRRRDVPAYRRPRRMSLRCDPPLIPPETVPTGSRIPPASPGRPRHRAWTPAHLRCLCCRGPNPRGLARELLPYLPLFPPAQQPGCPAPARATQSASVNWGRTRSDTRSLEPGVRLVTTLVLPSMIHSRSAARIGAGPPPAALAARTWRHGGQIRLSPDQAWAAEAVVGAGMRRWQPRWAGCGHGGGAVVVRAGWWALKRPGAAGAVAAPVGTARVAPPTRGGPRSPSRT